MSSHPLHRVAHLSHFPRESMDGAAAPEKLLRERSRAILSALGRVSGRPEGAGAFISSHEIDGGGRLVGEEAVAAEGVAGGFDRRSASDASTLPPPYSSHRDFIDAAGYVRPLVFCCLTVP